MLRNQKVMTAMLSCILLLQQVIAMPLSSVSVMSSEIATIQILDQKPTAIQHHNHTHEVQIEKEKCLTCGQMDCDCCINFECSDCKCSSAVTLLSLTYMEGENIHDLTFTYYVPSFTSELSNLPYRPPIFLCSLDLFTGQSCFIFLILDLYPGHKF